MKEINNKLKEENKGTAKRSTESILYQFRTFRFAFEGLGFFFSKESKALIHLIIAIVVIVCGFLLRFNLTDWVIVTIAIGVVFVAEVINTAIEHLVNLVEPNYNKQAKIIKDLAAGGVLLASVMAAVLGAIIFLPKLITLFLN